MNQLMNDDVARSSIPAIAYDALERFSLGKVIGMWECAFHKVMQDEH
jgi:hypothetical protein